MPKLLDLPTGDPCEVCGYIGIHATWCWQRVSDTCPVCGMDTDTPGVLRANVPPTDPNFGKAFPCPECYAVKMAKRVREAGQLQGELKKNTFENFGVTDKNRLAYNAALQFAATPTGWLTFYPDYGGGKTHLCAAIANELGPGRCRYYNTPDLTSALKDFERVDRIINEIARTPVIILDELDKAHIINWTREQMQRIFDHRYRNWDTLGLVIASNTEPEEFDGDLRFVGERMRDERFKCVEVRGNNRGMIGKLRDLAARQNFKQRSNAKTGG